MNNMRIIKNSGEGVHLVIPHNYLRVLIKLLGRLSTNIVIETLEMTDYDDERLDEVFEFMTENRNIFLDNHR